MREAWCEPPSDAELGELQAEIPALVAAGRVVRIGRAMHAHIDAVADVQQRVERIIGAEGSVTLARARDELGTSRKYAQALLEHLDAARVTRRQEDDSRVLRKQRSLAGERDSNCLKDELRKGVGMTESEYQVVWPLGRSAVQKIEVTSGVEGLDGRKVAFVWDYLFRGPEIFDTIKSEITARYPTAQFIDYEAFGNIHGVGRGGEGEPRTAARAHA